MMGAIYCQLTSSSPSSSSSDSSQFSSPVNWKSDFLVSTSSFSAFPPLVSSAMILTASCATRSASGVSPALPSFSPAPPPAAFFPFLPPPPLAFLPSAGALPPRTSLLPCPTLNRLRPYRNRISALSGDISPFISACISAACAYTSAASSYFFLVYRALARAVRSASDTLSESDCCSALRGGSDAADRGVAVPVAVPGARVGVAVPVSAPLVGCGVDSSAMAG